MGGGRGNLPGWEGGNCQGRGGKLPGPGVETPRGDPEMVRVAPRTLRPGWALLGSLEGKQAASPTAPFSHPTCPRCRRA